MKRGQLTLLLIVAAFVLFSALFMAYLVDKATPNATNDAFTKSSTDGKTATRLCLEDAGKQAIMQALDQGGVNEQYWSVPGNVETNDTGSKTRVEYIKPLNAADTTPETGEGAVRGTDFKSDGSDDAPAPYEYLDVGGVKVRFWIFRGKDYINFWPLGAPAEFIAPTPNDIDIRAQQGPYIGKLITEPLCAYQGFNRRGAGFDGSSSCLTYRILDIPNGPVSWQEALEARITASVNAKKECNIPGPVTVALGDDDVTLISGNESVVIPVRLKRMYNLAYNLAKYEMADPSFNPTVVTGTAIGEAGHVAIKGCQDRKFGTDCAVPGLRASVTQVSDPQECLDKTDTACTTGVWKTLLPDGTYEEYDDAWRQQATVVSIVDTGARIDGKNPTLRFAIKNRYPLMTGSGGAVNNEKTPGKGEFFDVGGIDADGTGFVKSCYTTTDLDLLPECTGAIDKRTESFPMDATTGFCDRKRVVSQCPVNEDICFESASSEPVFVIACSEPQGTPPGGRLVPNDWMSWYGPPAQWNPVTGALNALPRNCRLSFTTGSAMCYIQSGNTPPTQTCDCKNFACDPNPDHCPRAPTCLENWASNGDRPCSLRCGGACTP